MFGSEATGGQSGTVPDGGATETDAQPADPCAPTPGAAAPRHIDEVVPFLNAMPKPVELGCFLRHFPGQMDLAASISRISAQPAFSKRSPRIFIFSDPLILSVVPEGMGKDLLEMSELRDDGRSLKAELAFPVTEELAPDAPYTHALYTPMGTTCAFCHAQEERDPTIGFAAAFVSVPLRPPTLSLVSVDSLRAEASTCDASTEAFRCEMLDAIFSRPTVNQRTFPESFSRFE